MNVQRLEHNKFDVRTDVIIYDMLASVGCSPPLMVLELELELDERARRALLKIDREHVRRVCFEPFEPFAADSDLRTKLL